VWHHDASSHDQRHIQGFFLLWPADSQPVRLNNVVVDAILAAQAGRSNQSHQLLVFGWNGAFQVAIVVEIIEAFDQKIIGLIYIGVQTIAGVEKAARNFALVRDLLLGQKVYGLSAFRIHGQRLAESCNLE
jgi:hypothetical protein